MSDLIKALTELVKEATTYLARKNQPELPLVETAIEKPRRARRTRAEMQAAEAEPTVAPAEVEALPELTEEESAKKAVKTAEALLRRFAKQVDGKPEGYHMARKLLTERFKAAKIGDLTHAQRLKFIAEIEALIADADNMLS